MNKIEIFVSLILLYFYCLKIEMMKEKNDERKRRKKLKIDFTLIDIYWDSKSGTASFLCWNTQG